jgi:hypothetical protein
MLISNNMLAVTFYPNGAHHIEKSLALRTFSTGSSNIATLEQKPHTLSLVQIGEAVDLVRKAALKSFKEYANADDYYVVRC